MRIKLKSCDSTPFIKIGLDNHPIMGRNQKKIYPKGQKISERSNLILIQGLSFHNVDVVSSLIRCMYPNFNIVCGLLCEISE